MGGVIPLKVKPDPLTLACEMVMLDELALVRVADNACVLPTVTLPKLKAVGLELRSPETTPVPASVIAA
jgi:hypothetical protein